MGYAASRLLANHRKSSRRFALPSRYLTSSQIYLLLYYSPYSKDGPNSGFSCKLAFVIGSIRDASILNAD